MAEMSVVDRTLYCVQLQTTPIPQGRPWVPATLWTSLAIVQKGRGSHWFPSGAGATGLPAGV